MRQMVMGGWQGTGGGMMQPRWFIWTITLVLLPWSLFAAEGPSSSGALDTAKLDGLLKTIIPSIRRVPGERSHRAIYDAPNHRRRIVGERQVKAGTTPCTHAPGAHVASG